MEAYFKLRRVEQIFIDLWIEHGSPTEAVRRMRRENHGKPGTLKKRAWRMSHRPGIREAYEERLKEAIEEAGVTHFNTIRQLARIAHFDHRKLFDEKTGEPLPVNELPTEIATALLGVEVEDLFEGRGESRKHTGRIHKYKVESRVDAIKLLLQYQKLLIERHEVAGPNGGPIEIKDTRERNIGLIEKLAQREREVPSAVAGNAESAGASAGPAESKQGGVGEVSVGLAGVVGETQPTPPEL